MIEKNTNMNNNSVKQCRGECGKIKDVTQFYFSIKRNCYYYICTECHLNRQRAKKDSNKNISEDDREKIRIQQTDLLLLGLHDNDPLRSEKYLKRCCAEHCKLIKSSVDFYNDTKTLDGKSDRCSICAKKADNDRPNRKVIQQDKRCEPTKGCGEIKTWESFYRSIKNTDGLDRICINCTKERRRSNLLLSEDVREEYRKKQTQKLIDVFRIRVPIEGHLKLCPDCKYPKNIDDFNKNAASVDGFINVCKVHRSSKNPQTFRAIQYSANGKVATAIRQGVLLPPKHCDICLATNDIQGHHDDYSKPLSVRWLCIKCHTEWHHLNEFKLVLMSLVDLKNNNGHINEFLTKCVGKYNNYFEVYRTEIDVLFCCVVPSSI